MGILWTWIGTFSYCYNNKLRHNSNATGPSFGKRFKKEGILGICLNMNKGTLSFSLNGEFMGVAFTDPSLKKAQSTLWFLYYIAQAAKFFLEFQFPHASTMPDYYFN